MLCFNNDVHLSALQSIQTGPEAPGPASQAAVPSPVPGAVGSVWKQTAGVAKKTRATCASLPGPQRQSDGRCHHSGVSERSGRAQAGGQPLYHCKYKS